MAKAGFSLDFEPFEHTDPVSGEHKTFMRSKHSRQSSKRLKNFQKCMRDQLEGKNYRSGNARQDSQSVRRSFSEAARACSGGRS